MAETTRKSAPKPDAVCFTAGPKGAIFGVGVIHAYLAANRPAPKVVAGVSAGALSAAALQRCYQELEGKSGADLEAIRWKWFRRYLSFLIEKPLDIFWNVIPDLSDLLANRPPISENALPQDIPKPGERSNNKSNDETWKADAQDCRREYYLMVKLLGWLAHLRLSPSDLARMGIAYVRWKETYPDRFLPQILAQIASFIALLGNIIRILFWFSWAITTTPCTYWPWPYAKDSRDQKFLDRFPRPLFGAAYLFMGPALLGALGCLGLGIVGLILSPLIDATWSVFLIKGGLGLVLILILRLYAKVWKKQGPLASRLLLAIPRDMLDKTRLNDSLISNLYLKLKLDELFRKDGKKGPLDQTLMPALLVATPLEPLTSKATKPSERGKYIHNAQVYTHTRSSKSVPISVAEALVACLSVPVLLKPAAIEVELDETKAQSPWVNVVHFEKPPAQIHLVDGAVVCPSPLPSFFDQLKRWVKDNDPGGQARVESLQAEHLTDARVHLVHSTPIDPPARAPIGNLSKQGDLPPLPNSVQVAFDGLRLSSRRDSRLEVWQANYQSEFAAALPLVAITEQDEKPKEKKTLTILVDEIAPEDDLSIPNPLSPKESPLLRYAASGCRATLAALYRKELYELAQPSIDCPSFLRTRADRTFPNPAMPGVEEICSHCTKLLSLPERGRKLAAGEPYSKVTANKFLTQEFLDHPEKTIPKNLCRGLSRLPDGNTSPDPPRIVFLASGGVFRGAFHIGMLGAMWRLNMKPDLIVGASVGTLMGAVLGEMFAMKKNGNLDGAKELLHELADTFIRVDQNVAVTRQFKSAMRDLGTRAHTIGLSPNRLRKKIFQGASLDPGFAATGAPSELIDAISRIFVIPHEHTRKIAARFVAEDITGALTEFVHRLRDNTVVSLGISDGLLGTDLLEQALTRLLRHIQDPTCPQPFMDAQIGFLATTTNLVSGDMEILGVQPMQNKSYDFVQAALSSCAFPLAFPPRRESQIYPAEGRRDIFYGDGGMFDNLPFVPAMLVLGAAQASALRDPTVSAQQCWTALQDRFRRPDLFVVGALDVDPDQDRNVDYASSILAIHKRAGSLSKNIKTRRFERLSDRIDKYFSKTVEHGTSNGTKNELINNFVHTGVLTVAPSDEDHLNGTFAFCASLGLNTETVRKSIADGCYRMLVQTCGQWESGEDTPAKRALKGLSDRIYKIQPADASDPILEGKCPYFVVNGNSDCPFHHKATGTKEPTPDLAIWNSCVADRKHSNRKRSTP